MSPGSWSERNSWDPALPGRYSPLPRGSEGAGCPLVSEAAHPDSTGCCSDLCTLQLTLWQPREVASCNTADAPWQCRENILETGSWVVYGEGLTNRQSAVFSLTCLSIEKSDDDPSPQLPRDGSRGALAGPPGAGSCLQASLLPSRGLRTPCLCYWADSGMENFHPVGSVGSLSFPWLGNPDSRLPGHQPSSPSPDPRSTRSAALPLDSPR